MFADVFMYLSVGLARRSDSIVRRNAKYQPAATTKSG